MITIILSVCHVSGDSDAVYMAIKERMCPIIYRSFNVEKISSLVWNCTLDFLRMEALLACQPCSQGNQTDFLL